jgi:L-lactate dehydrogenase complex protein LldF
VSGPSGAEGSFTPAPIDMIGNTRRALRDAQLQRTLGLAMPFVRRQRDAGVARVPDWEALRARAAVIRDDSLEHLDAYLAQLEAQVTARGGRVHRAADAAEACRIVTDLARRHGVRRIVKSKSMVTEEIALNPALEAAGCTVVETDLGEYILQLAGEPPSHIVAPTIHKPAAAVADLFAAKLGVPRTERAEDLARVARETLRAEFLTATMGISGVNFAVAETGTLVVVENEGNARLTTTLPRIHVAVTGIEKVIPRLADLGVLLRLLAPSATGQRASVYVSLLSGPRRPGDADGPEELHLVLVDGGRTRLRADPELREALRCIRCAACLNACPVDQRAGGHAYGSVYGGPIGAVLTPALRGTAHAAQLPFASTLCGACAEVCPVKIDLPRLLLVLRQRVVRAGAGGRLDRVFARIWAASCAAPRRLAAGGLVARLFLRLVRRAGVAHRLPPVVSGAAGLTPGLASFRSLLATGRPRPPRASPPR